MMIIKNKRKRGKIQASPPVPSHRPAPTKLGTNPPSPARENPDPLPALPPAGAGGRSGPPGGGFRAGERRTPGCPSRPPPRRPAGLRVSTGRGKCVPRGRSGRPPRLGGAQRRGYRCTCRRAGAQPSQAGSAPLRPRRIHPGGSQIRPGGMRTPGLCGLRRGRAGLLVERHNNKCVAEPARKEWG